MPLPLVPVISSNFIKDFPSRNTVNNDLIDAYAGPSLITHPLQSYTPILTGFSADPVLGSGGFIRGFFYRIFDQIYTWGELRFGSSGASFGSGPWIVTLPFTADSIIGPSTVTGNAPVIGVGQIWDDSTAAGRQPVTVHLRTVTQIMFGNRMVSGVGSREVGIGGPISWAVNDALFWTAKYKRLP